MINLQLDMWEERLNQANNNHSFVEQSHLLSNKETQDKQGRQRINLRDILPNEGDVKIFQLAQKEYLYEIDFSKETFQKRMNFQLKQFQDIVRYYYSNKLSTEDFQQGIKISNEMSISGPDLKQKFVIILRNTIKRLEQYLTNNYNKQIISLSNEDLRIISLFILYHPQILSQEHINTLSRAMKMALDLPVKMQQLQLVDFYSHLLCLLQDKHSSKNIESRLLFKKQSCLDSQTHQIEMDICEQYLNEHNLNRIRQNILQKYESQEELKEYKEVDFYFIMERLLRKAYLKLKNQYAKHDRDLQHPFHINQHQYIYLVRSKEALPFRLALIAFFKAQYVFLNDIYNVIELMKSALQERAKKEKHKYKRNLIQTSEEELVATRRRKRTNFIESQEGESKNSDKESPQIHAPRVNKKKQPYEYRNKQLTLPQIYGRSGNKNQNKPQSQNQRKHKYNNYTLDNYKQG